jgi:hypothetical protein
MHEALTAWVGEQAALANQDHPFDQGRGPVDVSTDLTYLA